MKLYFKVCLQNIAGQENMMIVTAISGTLLRCLVENENINEWS